MLWVKDVFYHKEYKNYYTVYIFVRINLYRIKAMWDNSAKKGKGYYLGHIPLLYIDTNIGKLCLSIKEYAGLHNNGVK